MFRLLRALSALRVLWALWALGVKVLTASRDFEGFRPFRSAPWFRV